MTHPPSPTPGGQGPLSSRSNDDPARRLLFNAFRARRKTLLLAAGGAGAYTVTMVIVPLLSRVLLNDIVARRPLHAMTGALAGLLAVGVGRAATGATRKWQAAKLQALVGLDMRTRMYRHFQRLSFAYHDRLGPGELMSRVSGDVSLLESVVGVLPFMAQSIALGVCGLVVLFALQPVLAGADVVVVALAAAVALRLASSMYPLSRRLQDRLGDFGQFVEQQTNGIRVIKGLGFELGSLARGRALAAAAHHEGMGLTKERARFVTAFVVAPVSSWLVVVGLGTWLGAHGHMTAGDLFAFLQYLGLLIAPVMVASQIMALWPQAMGAAGRIAEVLAAEPDVADPPQPRALPPGPGTVRFDGVWFGYHPSKPVLKGLDLAVDGGTSVALVGASGAGKTTLAYLLPRFYDAWGGQVTIDGMPVTDLGLAELRKAVSIVFEDTVIFSDTIRRNITMARPEATDAEVRDAAARAHAAEFIEALPDGYDTVVGEQGASLSGGQRQRIAIARAILARPRVLILDDATSAVDPATDEAIRRGLIEVLDGRTALIIAHRVETLELADRVVLLDDGVVVADGRHDDLLEVPAYRAALALDDEIVVR
jgi:ATP-binding cassette subfamily B protein